MKWVPDSYLDLILEQVKNSDGESICSQQPLTYFNAAHPQLHELSTAYTLGEVVRPPTHNGYVYECVQGGTTGSSEPGWGTVQDQEFGDGSVIWKTHENYSLAHTAIDGASITIENGDADGRKITVPQVMGVVTHATGTVSHCALIEDDTQTLHLVTDAVTTIPEDNDVVEGRTTIFFEFQVVVRDPQ